MRAEASDMTEEAKALLTQSVLDKAKDLKNELASLMATGEETHEDVEMFRKLGEFITAWEIRSLRKF